MKILRFIFAVMILHPIFLFGMDQPEKQIFSIENLIRSDPDNLHTYVDKNGTRLNLKNLGLTSLKGIDSLLDILRNSPLREIKVNNNTISELYYPYFFSIFDVISAKNNQIQNTPYEIPSGKKLNLSGNPINNFPAILGDNSMLVLVDNQIAGIPHNLSLGNNVIINLKRNPLTAQTSALIDTLQKYTFLQKFNREHVALCDAAHSQSGKRAFLFVITYLWLATYLHFYNIVDFFESDSPAALAISSTVLIVLGLFGFNLIQHFNRIRSITPSYVAPRILVS